MEIVFALMNVSSVNNSLIYFQTNRRFMLNSPYVFSYINMHWETNGHVTAPLFCSLQVVSVYMLYIVSVFQVLQTGCRCVYIVYPLSRYILGVADGLPVCGAGLLGWR